MNSLFCLLALVACKLTTSSVIGPSTHWLKSPSSSKSDESENIRSVFRLRGGEEVKTETTEKIKGCCIGIDLGTTYR
jgi:hypothetical protein